MSEINTKRDAVAALCPNCGLCCNGVLFGDVELKPGDDEDVADLSSLGVRLKRRGTKVRLLQPCSCFDGTLCRIYVNRPLHCRAFECRLLQKVQSGAMRSATALKRIAEARRCVEQVRGLLEALGDRDEQVPLSKRCANQMAEPLDLGGDLKTAKLRSKLMVAANRLMRLLHRHFLD